MPVHAYCGLLLLASILVAVVAYGASCQRLAWWKDAAQIAGVMAIVATMMGTLIPPSARELEAKAREAEARQTREATEALEASLEKLRQKQIADAMFACSYAIQAQLQYPGSYSESYFSGSNRQIETDQGWEIYKAFEAKNGFGGSLPHVGHCSVLRSGSISVAISRS